MKGLFDTYSIPARVFPSVLSAIPVFVLLFFLSGDVELRELGKFLLSLKFYGGITLGLVGLYSYAQIIRFVSKLLEEAHFIRRSGFPSTYLMTYADSTYSKAYKDKYRTKVKHDFDIDLLDETGEAQNPDEAKKRLAEATKQVILKVQKGQLVFKHNVWYGFIRNLIGGAFFSLAFCIINIIVGLTAIKNIRLVVTSLVLVVPYGLLLLLRTPLLRQNAEAYASQLIAEYMSLGA